MFIFTKGLVSISALLFLNNWNIAAFHQLTAYFNKVSCLIIINPEICVVDEFREIFLINDKN
jgi:hypothetical protein